jgi:hypothetical protein
MLMRFPNDSQHAGPAMRCFLALCTLLTFSTSAIERGNAGERVDYVRDVLPILETYCIGCHSRDDPQGGLVMDDFKSLLQGGDSGPAVTPGVSGSSRLLLMASGQLEPVMPPDGAEGPNDAELEVLANWIDQGAKGPRGDMPIKRKLSVPELKPAPNVARPITAVAPRPDGQLSAVATFANIEIRGQNGPASEPLRQISDPDLGKVNSLTFSRDGTKLLAASGLTGAYGRAVIYDVKTGKRIREFVGHSDILYDAAFSPDEQLIATAGYDRKIVLWNAKSGEPLRELTGHNGAIFDLAFSPNGKVLVSACADETAKVWSVSSGERLDTLSQPEGEVFAVTVTRDGRFIVAGSGDNRLRVWRLRSTEAAQINPLVATRFIDETPVTNIAASPDGQWLVVLAESGNVKVVRTSDWTPVASLPNLGELGTDLYFQADGRSFRVALMNGEMVSRRLPTIAKTNHSPDDAEVSPIYMDFGQPTALNEADLRSAIRNDLQPADLPEATLPADAGRPLLDVPRNARIRGAIEQPGEADWYRWRAGEGEVWAIDVDATSGSRLDPIVTVLDAAGEPVLRVRLQAIRDSYFTFRGKNSTQTNDFRVFNWQEMKLGQFLYAAGEVTRLWMHPRGPDSGFEVYPADGDRWTYFGTSGTTHALGEPAYIVRPLPRGGEPLANGLPVFDIDYENDDDPLRKHGKNSRLIFKAPEDGLYSVRVRDTRGEGGQGEGGKDYGYQLSIRAADPSFEPSVAKLNQPLHPGTGREFKLSVQRSDGYMGPITFEIDGVPESLTNNFPVTVEAGQNHAVGMIWAAADEQGWDLPPEPTLTAWAMVNGRRVERSAGSIGKLQLKTDRPQVVPVISPIGDDSARSESWTLQVRRGETVSAQVSIDRKDGFQREVSFGKERSGRNATQGVYVDNIGLNGLLILGNASKREFFVTADETAVPGKRSFFLTANVDGGITTQPITVEVLP